MVKRFRESDIGLKGDKGPKWDGRPTTWSAFWYGMKVYLALQKLKETVAGTDRVIVTRRTRTTLWYVPATNGEA